MQKTLKRLWRDESAQGTIEYILMLVIVVGFAFIFRTKIKEIISGKVDKLGTDIRGFE